MSESDLPVSGPESLLQTLPGATCYYGDEARRRRRVEAVAAEVLEGWGYEEILLPVFDYAEVFARGGGRWSERASYRFTEGGELLSLRTDFTALAAKAAVTRLPPGARRLCYRGEVMRRPGRSLGPAALSEVGVEHYAGGLAADLEILLVALEILDRLGIRGAVCTLGHAGYPLGLMDEALAALPPACREEAREEVLRGLWRKDRSRIREALGDAAMPLLDALDCLGGVEAVGAGRRPRLPGRAAAAVDRLTQLADVLAELGIIERFRFDLAELRGFDYYTGVIFEIHGAGAGREIGGGGRYDDLFSRFGASRPAVGFSLPVGPLAQLLPPLSGGKSEPKPVVAPAGRLAEAFREVREARAGNRAVRVVSES